MERRSGPAPPLACRRAGRPGYGRLGRGQDAAPPAPSGSAIPGRVEGASDGARVRTCGPGRGRRRSAGMPGPPLPARTAEGAAPGRVAGPGSGVPGRAPRGRHVRGSMPTCRSVSDAARMRDRRPALPDRARRDVRPTRPRPSRRSARCRGAAVRPGSVVSRGSPAGGWRRGSMRRGRSGSGGTSGGRSGSMDRRMRVGGRSSQMPAAAPAFRRTGVRTRARIRSTAI